MAWSKIGTDVGVAIAAGSGTQSITLPGPPEIGDLILVAIGGDISCADSIASSGYTVPDNGTGANPGANFGYKALTTAETVVLINKNATILKSCVVQVWRGGNASEILDQSYPTPVTGNSANPNPPSIVTQNANALVVAIAYLDDDDSTVTTYPSGYTNGKSANTGQGSTTIGSTVALCSKEVATPGTEDPGAYTMSSSDQWQAGTISFRIQGPEEHSGSAIISGNGSLTGTVQKGGKGTALTSAGGTLIAIGIAGMLTIASISGGGAQAASGQKSIVSSVIMSGNGSLIATGEKSEGEQHSGVAVISGNGALSSEGEKTALNSISISGNGSTLSQGKKNAQNCSAISGGGVLASVGAKQSFSDLIISGNGSQIGSGQKCAFVNATISGNGSLIGTGKNGAGPPGAIAAALGLAMAAIGKFAGKSKNAVKKIMGKEMP